jgi:8-oxo-dGTP pyrophosphatase MutT (NUDIX family)
MNDLERNSHCSYCGSYLKDQSIDQRTCDFCGEINYLNPLPVVIVMIKVYNEGLSTPNGILVVKRNIPPKKGQWALPGGFINAWENWEASAAREVEEEIGLYTEPYDYELFSVETGDYNHILIFCNHKYGVLWNDIRFIKNEEVSAIYVASPAMELAFPLHTKNFRKYMEQ